MIYWIIRKLANFLSGNQGANKLNILTYHRVSDVYDEKNPQIMSIALFTLQMQWLKKHFVVLPLPEAIALQELNALPDRAVSITIDDGYRDGYEFIYEVLKQENISATFFISTKGIEDGGLWDHMIYSAICNAPTSIQQVECAGRNFNLSNLTQRNNSRYQLTEFTKYFTLAERKKAIEQLRAQTSLELPEPYFLSAEQIKIMHDNGMTIGAHTHNHPILAKEQDDIALDEIKQSKDILENIIGEPVEIFAYPNGKYAVDYDERHINMVNKLGFKAALSTDWGALSNIKDQKFNIKRFTPWDESELYFVLRLALNYRN